MRTRLPYTLRHSGDLSLCLYRPSRKNPEKETLTNNQKTSQAEKRESANRLASLILDDHIDTISSNLIMQQDTILDALKQINLPLTKNRESIKINSEIEEKIIKLIKNTTIVNLDIKKELEISKYLEELTLPDLAAQRLLKILETDKVVDDSALIATRLRDLTQNSISTKITEPTIESINSTLEKLLTVPIDSSQVKDITLGNPYVENETRFAEIFGTNDKLGALAKQRLLSLLFEDLSFFDKKCIYDCLKKNHTITEDERNTAGLNIIRTLKFKKNLDRDSYQFILDGLSEICKETKLEESDKRSCSGDFQELLGRINRPSYLLPSLIFINKLTPFQDQSGNLTASGQKWQELLRDKILDSRFVSQPKYENQFTDIMSLLNLDSLNAERLSEALNKFYKADNLYNLYTAASKSLDKIKSQNELTFQKEINSAVQKSLETNLLASLSWVQLNEKNLDGSIKYMNLFTKYSTDQKDGVNTSKINQMRIGLIFFKQATSRISLNPLLTKMSQIFEGDKLVGDTIRQAISKAVWKILVNSPSYTSKEARLNEYKGLYINNSKILLETAPFNEAESF